MKSNCYSLIYSSLAQALLISTFKKIGLIRVTYDPPVSIRVNQHFKWLILKCDTSLESSAQAKEEYIKE